MAQIDPALRQAVQDGLVIPACPLALAPSADRRVDVRRQRALFRYYVAAGAGGLAIGVHTTQFAIREHGLYEPLLALAQTELNRIAGPNFLRVGGVCGQTAQALREACLLMENGFHAGLLSLGALRDATETDLLKHAAEIAKVVPLIGFYLQPAAGGRSLPYTFWRRFADIENVLAIKIAPFNRYQTIDVIRAVSESGRHDIALYTGNDDNIIADLTTPFWDRCIVGGLLGQWAVWTKPAVELLARLKPLRRKDEPIPSDLLRLGVELTDANAAIFDASNRFAGCIPGIHEILRRQGLLDHIACLDPSEVLSPGQSAELERVRRAYPHLTDDHFVKVHLPEWLN
jgi:dihydrodipicolinate synthase/N-acetylneuraminate lyase